MKKSKNMLILFGVLVVLLAVYFGIDHYNDSKDEKEAKNTSYITDVDGLEKISYDNGEDTFTFVKKDDKWHVEDTEDFPLTQSIPEQLESTFKKLEAVRELKNADELGDYGLEEPSLTISLTADDGSEISLYVGNAAGDDYYMTEGDKNKVYTVSSSALSSLSFDLNSMAELDEFPTIGSGKLKEAAITEDGKTTTYKSSNDDDEETINSIEGGLGTFAFSACANYKATGDDLAEYGLDEENRTTVKFTYKDDDKKTQTVTLYVGSTDDTGQTAYVQLDGSDMVCTASASSVNTILNK